MICYPKFIQKLSDIKINIYYSIITKMNFKCNNCLQIFKTKQNFQKHQTKIFKCNEVTNFQCIICLKYFKTKSNLNKHNDTVCVDETNIIIASSKSTSKSTSKTISKDDTIVKHAIKSILNSQISDENKAKLLVKYNTSLSKEDLTDLIKLDIPLDGKISYIHSIINSKKETNINTISNSNINSNNTTNIQINNFGKENLDYLDSDYFKNLILNNHIEKGYMTLIKDIYLDKEHPENRTVKVDNINNKYALVFNDGKWESILKYELKELLHKKNHTLLKMQYKKLKDLMDTAKKDEISVFLSRDDTSDPHMMYVIDKVVLLFYNGKEIYEI